MGALKPILWLGAFYGFLKDSNHAKMHGSYVDTKPLAREAKWLLKIDSGIGCCKLIYAKLLRT